MVDDRSFLVGEELEEKFFRLGSVEELLDLCLDTPLDLLVSLAGKVRDQLFEKTVSFSRNVFIPLTNLCRNNCAYCCFRVEPWDPKVKLLTRKEALSIIDRGVSYGCTEALLTFGEKPEEKYEEAKRWLKEEGYDGIIDFLLDLCLEALERGILPHINPGVIEGEEMKELRKAVTSMGLMLESSSSRLCEDGGPHALSPTKHPSERLKVMEEAGTLKIPFTTGILVGIGETWRERVESLLEIKKIHEKYGHIQEIIIQNFVPKAGTSMENHPPPTEDELLRTIALARLMFRGEVSVQAPPNLVRDKGKILQAGINDWGGVSPITIDYVNPEKPWPSIKELEKVTLNHSLSLRERLPVYPQYVNYEWLDKRVYNLAKMLKDDEGFARLYDERVSRTFKNAKMGSF